MPRCLKLPAALLLTVPVLLALPPAGAQQERDWYTVEVILFRHWSGSDTERFDTEAPPPEYQRLTVLRGDGKRAFGRLRGSELQLQGTRERLSDSPDYEVLEHFGWQQPGLSRNEAISVALPLNWQPGPLTFNAEMHPLGIPVMTAPERDPDRGDTPANEPRQSEDSDDADTETDSNPAAPGVFDGLPARTQLFGTLTLYRERYLHVDADLRYRHRRYQPSWTERETSTGNPLYVMNQRRRMRSDELHYLDHPTIGVLIRLTPMERARTETAADGEAGEQPQSPE
jgi:hypothetical protein